MAWRYWVRRPTSEEEIASSFGDNSAFTVVRKMILSLTFFCPESRSTTNSSCRIHVSFHGFEWFLYNRTAAFDNIISQMRAQPSANAERRAPLQKSSGNCFFHGLSTPSLTLILRSERSSCYCVPSHHFAIIPCAYFHREGYWMDSRPTSES